MIIAGTGHREPGPGSVEGVRIRIRNKLKEVQDKNVESIISGMAAGFDLWLADEAIELGLPVIAAVPWKGHTPRVEDKELYAKVLAAAVNIVYVNEAEKFPGNYCYQDRNVWMVDNATHIMSYYSGSGKGGTYNCLEYIKTKDPRPLVHNIWNDPPF